MKMRKTVKSVLAVAVLSLFVGVPHMSIVQAANKAQQIKFME